MTYREYFELLSSHDWFFSFSDDNNVYEAGNKNLQKLKSIANKSTSTLPIRMLHAWEEHIFSGESFGTDDIPEPKLEDFKA